MPLEPTLHKLALQSVRNVLLVMHVPALLNRFVAILAVIPLKMELHVYPVLLVIFALLRAGELSFVPTDPIR